MMMKVSFVGISLAFLAVAAEAADHGVATMYGGNVGGNGCGFNSMNYESFPHGFGAAIGTNNFNSGYGCGTCWRVKCLGPEDPTNTGCHCDPTHPEVIVWANDQCPECSDHHLDLNTEAMEYICGDGVAGTCGRINIDFEQVNCDMINNIQIRNKEGTSGWWYGLHVDNVAGYGGISSVTLKEGGYTHSCAKSEGPSFWKCDLSSRGGQEMTTPVSVTLIDKGGREISCTNCITSLAGGALFDFGAQYADVEAFPVNPVPSPTAHAPAPTAPATSPTSNGSPTTPASGQASTTRYWDCSGGACGCAYIPSQFNNDHSKPSHCYSNAMFAAPAGNEHGATFYGAAAVSQALGGGDWLADGCGKCYKVTGTSNIPNYDMTTVTTVVLKATNYCPPANSACNGKAHFDIAAPGFDYAGTSISNTCTEREPDEIAGFGACGRWLMDSPNPADGCDCNNFNNAVLRDGCENFKSLYWNNPTVDYEEVDCPAELAQLPCWEENGNTYPWPVAPALCMDPLANAAPTAPAPEPNPVAAPVPAPQPEPVAAPVPAPQPEPVAAPVPAPQPEPVAAPVPAPQPNPVPAPVPAPTDPLPGCCSINFKTCGGGCETYNQCGASGECADRIWLGGNHPGNTNNCIQRWTGGCNSDADCCVGLFCDVSNPYWKSCQLEGYVS